MWKRTQGLTRFLAASQLVWIWPLFASAQNEVGKSAAPGQQLRVNWIYGAYVPIDQPLTPLTQNQRLTLYLRQTFTTPGIYVKTGLFSIADQISNSPPEWGRNLGGFAQRMASRQGQFVIQNSFASLGNALLGYEPRYDRCRCSGFWPRTQHALLRNFVTYNRTDASMRPQIASYGAALAAGAISSTWKPHSDAWAEGYRSLLTQVGFGVLSNLLGEFAPDIMRVVHRHKEDAPGR